MTQLMKISNATAVVLAGGRSVRMGEDKRFIKIGEQTLFDRVVDCVESLFEEVIISVASEPNGLPTRGHRVVADAMPNCATLGGVYSSLEASIRDWIFAVACDMPLVNLSVIRRLADARDDVDFVMARVKSRLQPMHAFYRKTCLPVLAEMARGGDFRLQGLVSNQMLQGLVLTDSEVIQSAEEALSFLNVNTPTDLALARELLERE
ncbi:MAG: molybdenum cofactor guanylyltransferase [Nitrospiraceae bacterium]